MSLILPPATAAFSAYKASRPSTDTNAGGAAPGVHRISLQLKRTYPAAPGANRLRAVTDRAAKQSNVDLAPLLDSIRPIIRGEDPERALHELNALCQRSTTSPEQHRLIHARIEKELQARVAELAREWRGSIMGRESGWLGRLVGGWRVWQARTVRFIPPGV